MILSGVISNFIVVTGAAILMLAGAISGGGVDVGNGIVYRLPANADTFLYSSPGQSYRDFLIVSFHPGYPKKRTLVKFDTSHLPSSCDVIHAKMYLHFWYAHKPSFLSVQQVPYLSRPLQVHRVLRQWSEATATATYRLPNVRWNEPYGAIDGTDVSHIKEDTVTFVANRPSGYVEFDVKNAVEKWVHGQPNYGLMIWDPTEAVPGREIRFYSRENDLENVAPFLNVLCKYPHGGSTGGGNTGGGNTGGGNTGGGNTGGGNGGGEFIEDDFDNVLLRP